MRYTSFGIEDYFLILDFLANTENNEHGEENGETDHQNHQSTQTEALQRKKK